MAVEIAFKRLIEWHQQRAADCFMILACATIVPKSEMQALRAMARFHIAAARLLQTFESQGRNNGCINRRFNWLSHLIN